MFVFLVVIRLESENNIKDLSHIQYEAPHFKISVTYDYNTIQMDNSENVNMDDESAVVSSKTLQEINRGQRMHSDINIETYVSDISTTECYTPVLHHHHSSTISDSITQTSVTQPDSGPSYTTDVRDSPDSQTSEDSKGVASHDGVSRLNTMPKTSRLSPKLHYFSGNPTVEITKGILHLYKDSKMVSTKDDVPRSDMICMLTVPATHTTHDLIEFLASVNMGIEYMRIIRDTKPNNYMVLIKFYDQKLADDFFSNYNNIPFNSMETHICHLVYVARIETLSSTQGASLPVPGLTELPNCPVCLERMDESVDGVLTILCNHSFHISCLSQWPDTTCPVCRYVQTPEQSAENKCHECGSQESLWICLICGHIGCGRYIEMHAYRHFQLTHHCYSMHLGNNHVWDYAGDNYVHRLVQNKADGKLVEVDEGGNVMREEKLDSLNLEYTFLLTSQLESQRMYFEEKMNKIEDDSKKEIETLKTQYEEQATNYCRMEHELLSISKEKISLDKKCSQLNSKLLKVLKELQDEKSLNSCLTENQKGWQEQVTKLQNELQQVTTTKDVELCELRDQLRDIMFHIEGHRQLSETDVVSQEEVQQAEVVVGASKVPSRKSRKKGR